MEEKQLRGMGGKAFSLGTASELLLQYDEPEAGPASSRYYFYFCFSS
jgi:hypothetical protein